MPEPPAPPFRYAYDSRLRLRFWIAGQLRDEVWLDSADPDAGNLAEFVSAYHLRLSEMADAVGLPWLTEVYDPGAPEAEAYLRFGTDTKGMVEPAQLKDWHQSPMIRRTYGPPPPRDRPDGSGPQPSLDGDGGPGAD